MSTRFFCFDMGLCAERGALPLPCTFVSLLRADLQCKRFGPHFLVYHLAKDARRDYAATAARFLLSLRLHLFCVPRLTASCLCPFLLFTKRRKPQRGKEGKGCPCLKVFCAPADAQPLIPAVPEAWQSLWLFDVAEQEDSEDFQPFPRSAARYETGSDTTELHKSPE